MAGTRTAGTQPGAGSYGRTLAWRALAAFLLASGLAGGARASEVERSLTMPSRILGKPLRFSVYFPDGYAQRKDGPYPVLFLLHGTDGNENDWLDLGHLQQTADDLIRRGKIPPMLIVTPDAGNSWYVDNADAGRGGLYASAFLGELVPFVDARFDTVGDRRGRAIAGLSMGGFGALRLVLARPDLFVAAASLSGALFMPDEPLTPADIADLHGAFGTPFERARLERNDPFRMLGGLACAEAPAIYLASGAQDGFRLDEATASFYLALKRAGIPSSLRIRSGGHDWKFWSDELGPTLRFIARAFAGNAVPKPPRAAGAASDRRCEPTGAGDKPVLTSASRQ
ncbi:alpha/beta hydrolase [Benzoatithermus flavus]|uniref:Alpha/beta hydrolase family protein n=1 Tax=Benzoatithermus flavus TaxID=3108223 RepID=A0ABU8XP96_9PROT